MSRPGGDNAIETEWTLTCLDCDFGQEISTEGHPRDGPPDIVRDRVTTHKHAMDESHIVRVEGRLADRDDTIDPSLMTDGGSEELNAMERQADALEDVAEQMRIQNATLVELTRTLDKLVAVEMTGRPEDARSGRSVAGWVEDAVLDLEENVDLDAVDRVSEVQR